MQQSFKDTAGKVFYSIILALAEADSGGVL